MAPGHRPHRNLALAHLADQPTGHWQVHESSELALILGLGKGTGRNSPLFRTFDRLARFGFGYYDIEPGHSDTDPCITLWATTGLVPQRISRGWPAAIQRAHTEDLADLRRTI